MLGDEASVYKLVGPALIKQDPVEATSNVQKRLDYIVGELTRLDGQLKGLEEKQFRKQQQVCHLCHSAFMQAGTVTPLLMALLHVLGKRRPHK